jgi:hypothetical protein
MLTLLLIGPYSLTCLISVALFSSSYLITEQNTSRIGLKTASGPQSQAVVCAIYPRDGEFFDRLPKVSSSPIDAWKHL